MIQTHEQIAKKEKEMTFDEWISQLKQYGKDRYFFTDAGIAKTDWNAFRDYFDGGYSSKEALDEDMSYA
jgi:hypothetical protein